MGRKKADTDPKARSISRGRRAARAGIAVLPTLFTLGNLLCGFAAIFFASRPAGVDLPWGWTTLEFAAVFICLGMVFDGLDGRIARKTGQTSDLGEQLDSMADMVTCGVAPAFIAVQLVGIETPFLSAHGDKLFDRLTLVVAGIYVACAALRLARFNIELTQPEEADHASFKGLPSPGAAGTVASLVLLHQHLLSRQTPDHWTIMFSSIAMVVIMALVAFAMVSKIRYMHVINRYFRGRTSFGRIVIIVALLGLLVIWLQVTLAAACVAYALSAPLGFALGQLRARRAKPVA